MPEYFTEEMRVKGEQLTQKIKELIHEGNVRSITIHDKEGTPVLVLPLSVGVIGAVFAPTLAAVGAVAALLTECTISVERKQPSAEPVAPPPPPPPTDIPT